MNYRIKQFGDYKFLIQKKVTYFIFTKWIETDFCFTSLDEAKNKIEELKKYPKYYY